MNQNLEGVQRQLKERGDQLRQARRQLADRDRQLADLQVQPHASNLGVLEGEDLGEKTGQIIEGFHTLYYNAYHSGGTWHDTYWLGIPIWKCPLDLWIFQEIIFDL